MRIGKILIITFFLIVLLIPTGAAIANGVPPDDLPPGDVSPDEEPPSNPQICASTTAPSVINCGGISFNPSYLNGQVNLAKNGRSVRITTTGLLYIFAQLSFPLPEGFDAHQCTFYKDGVALPNTVFAGNNNNAYIYINQPPGSINGTYTMSCSN